MIQLLSSWMTAIIALWMSREETGVFSKTSCLAHHHHSLCCEDLNRSLGMAIFVGDVCVYICTYIYKNASLRISIKHYVSFANNLLTRRSFKVEEEYK